VEKQKREELTRQLDAMQKSYKGIAAGFYYIGRIAGAVLLVLGLWAPFLAVVGSFLLHFSYLSIDFSDDDQGEMSSFGKTLLGLTVVIAAAMAVFKGSIALAVIVLVAAVAGRFAGVAYGAYKEDQMQAVINNIEANQ